MKKIDELVKRVDYFERLAVYGDRSTFLKRIAQDASYRGFQGSTMVGDSGEPEYSDEPLTNPVQTVKETIITGNPPTDKVKKLQNMLNELLFLQQKSPEILPLREDGILGPQTKDALAKFKTKYKKPATFKNIAEEFDKMKSQSTVARDPGAAMAPIRTPLSLPVSTRSISDGSAGTERPVPGPRP